jgi:hypothetical protein
VIDPDLFFLDLPEFLLFLNEGNEQWACGIRDCVYVFMCQVLV